MKRAIYIPFDHLHRKHGALKSADPKSDLIVFVESARMTTGRNWHKERLFFLISSARHFAKLLEEATEMPRCFSISIQSEVAWREALRALTEPAI